MNSQISDMMYQVAGGTGTAIPLITQPLINGYSKTFIASANNNGIDTTINGKKSHKPNTTIAPNLIAGKTYTIWYNSVGDCFFIKASAEGDAGVSHVLADKKFSNDNDTGLIGTIPSKAAAVYTLGTTNQIIASGQYLSEIQTILGDANLISTNIISGKSIFGVSGSASVTSLGGKQFASESTLASSLTLTYPCIGGTSFAGYEIVISGLTFTPRYIIAKAISAESEYVTIYDEILFKTKKTASMYYLNSSSGKATISVFAANSSSYEGGFKIPVEQNTNDYEWYAFG